MVQSSLMVRIYVRESKSHIQRLVQRLAASDKVRGLTVIRADMGVGTSDTGDDFKRTSEGDPPLILEFFDREDAARETIALVRSLVRPKHIVTWKVEEHIF